MKWIKWLGWVIAGILTWFLFQGKRMPKMQEITEEIEAGAKEKKEKVRDEIEKEKPGDTVDILDNEHGTDIRGVINRGKRRVADLFRRIRMGKRANSGPDDGGNNS